MVLKGIAFTDIFQRYFQHLTWSFRLKFVSSMEKRIYRDFIEITASRELKLFVRSIAASYRFVFEQEKYEFVQRVMKLDLVDINGVGMLASRFASADPGEKLELTREEVYLLYTMMELVCRSFLCDVGDDYKRIAMRITQASEEQYNQVRSTELMIAQTLIGQIRKDLMDDPDFESINERLELLDK